MKSAHCSDLQLGLYAVQGSHDNAQHSRKQAESMQMGKQNDSRFVLTCSLACLPRKAVMTMHNTAESRQKACKWEIRTTAGSSDLQLGLFATQGSHDNVQLLLGCSQFGLLGLYHLGHPVIRLHCTHPAAQPISCLAHLAKHQTCCDVWNHWI